MIAFGGNFSDGLSKAGVDVEAGRAFVETNPQSGS